MATGQVVLPSRKPWLLAGTAALLAFLAVGAFGVYRYVDNYWLYRGFAPPHDPAYVKVRGTTVRVYPTLYLLHGVPGRPGAFLATVRMGVVEDELVALHKARPMILVMPFGSTGSFTDEEWANGVRPHSAWETFLARDVVRYVDTHFRTIPHGWARGLAGLSEGGYGSLNIGLHHPGEFRLLESWSGYSKADPIPSIFGKSKQFYDYNSPLLMLKHVRKALRREHTFIWFYIAKKDHGFKENQWFARALERDRIPHKYYVFVHGGHNWALWRGNAARAYLAASKVLRGP